MPRRSGRSVDDLLLTSIVEYGVVFSTGRPVTFRYVRNTERAPYFGARFQQDIEPSGRYLLHNPDPDDLPRGWEAGSLSFESPLVLVFNVAPRPDDPIYGPWSWKARLYDHYRKRREALARAVVADGFDGIVTVEIVLMGSRRGTPIDTREIVDLTRFR